MINKVQLKQLIKEELSKYLAEYDEEPEIDLSGEYEEPEIDLSGEYEEQPTPKLNLSKENADFVLFAMDKDLGTFGIKVTHGGETSTQRAHIEIREQTQGISRYIEKRQETVGIGILQIAGAVQEFTVRVSDQNPRQFIFRIPNILSVTAPIEDAKKGFPFLKQQLQAKAQELIA